MDKRYQVFISSTFIDLQDERLKVQQAVMELECIPAGMEAFPAIDEEQFEFIKKVIDDCDYYLLIIGGRYGSVSNEGISYTEMEYDYAVSKDIKVIVFLHKNPGSLSAIKTEQSDKLRKKLNAFKKKVSTGRLIRYWNNADELQGLVSTSLSKTIRTYPAVGWVRGNSVPSTEVYKELNDLRKENDALREAMRKQGAFAEAYDIEGLEYPITLKVSLYDIFESTSEAKEKEISWGNIFYFLAPLIHGLATENSIIEFMQSFVHNIFGTEKDSITSYDFITPDLSEIRIQFRALDLITLSRTENGTAWQLTERGERLLLIDRAKRKQV
jgi:hypothetical protein